MRLLHKWAKNEGINFTAYYDNGIFCGLTYTSKIENSLYIMYLAVADNMRSKGYGSEIINKIKSINPGCTIYLSIETLDSNAENYEQRLKRQNFYSKNGFISTKKLSKFDKDYYLILSTSKEFNQETYIALIKNYNKKFIPTIIDE